VINTPREIWTGGLVEGDE